MTWFLLRQDSGGTRLTVAEFDTEQAARDALASYQHHYPQYAPYFVEAAVPSAAPAPPTVAGPMPRIMPAPAANPEMPEPSGSTTGQNAVLLVVGGFLVVAALVAGALFVTGSDDGEIAAEPTPTPIERGSQREPTAPPVVAETVPAQPAPTQTDEAEPPPKRPAPEPDDSPTPEPEEVELTQGGSTTENIFRRGALNCGVSGRAFAFSEVQADGSMAGFDADMCRAVAAAILGDREAVNFVELTAAERFTALATGEVDVLMRNSTFTQSRDIDLGADFGPTTYYDGQQLMGRVSDGFSTDSQLSDIDGAIVCTNAGTTTERNIALAAEEEGLSLELLTFEDFNIVMDSMVEGTCDIVTTDGSFLLARRAQDQPDNEEWVVFPQIPLSKEPLGPIYRQDDSQFADIVNWTVYAMLTADEENINQENVIAVAADPTSAQVDRLLGGPGEVQSLMGLSPDAFLQVILQVGSYSDVFNRNLAPVGLQLEGSLNDLWSNGGIMYPPPVR